MKSLKQYQAKIYNIQANINLPIIIEYLLNICHHLNSISKSFVEF